MTAAKAAEAADQTGFTVSGAIDRIRTTATWLITVFGAVAAAILTGVSFSQVLAVEFGPAILLCIFGVLVSITGAASAILAAGRVLAARPARNSESINANFEDPVRFFPFTNPVEMKARLIENSRKYKVAQAVGNQSLMKAIVGESTSLISRLFDWSDVYSVRKLYDEFDRCLEAAKIVMQKAA